MTGETCDRCGHTLVWDDDQGWLVNGERTPCVDGQVNLHISTLDREVTIPAGAEPVLKLAAP